MLKSWRRWFDYALKVTIRCSCHRTVNEQITIFIMSSKCVYILIQKFAGNLKLQYLSNRTSYVDSDTGFEFYSFCLILMFKINKIVKNP